MVQNDRVDLTPLITHHFFALEELPDALDLFRRQADGAMKVAIHPAGVAKSESRTRELADVEC
jgi:threonine dehydrogenase-like Zn-dependent dehydrogenase